MKKICIVVSTPMTVKAFLLKHLTCLSQSYQVTVVSSSDINFQEEYGINCISKKINIDRKINILQDIKSMFALYTFLKKEKFDAVLSVTPKAGLISSIASFFAAIKIRIHFFTGQVWVTKQGFFKKFLKMIDKLIATLNTHSLVDSFSQRNFLIGEGILKEIKSNVLLSGSISGVDTKKFKFNETLRNELRQEYSIEDGEIVFLFIGRLNIDKGIIDLNKAFQQILKQYSHVKLFLVGPDEENLSVKLEELLNHKQVIRLDYVSNPEKILNIADVIVLPSYREGFGTIVIEAAAMGVPTIASDIYGLNDAIIDNKTGILHTKKDINDMITKYKFVINNLETVREMGQKAQERVYREFKDEELSKALKKYIEGLIETND